VVNVRRILVVLGLVLLAGIVGAALAPTPRSHARPIRVDCDVPEAPPASPVIVP
jgi:hypothetical protein